MAPAVWSGMMLATAALKVSPDLVTTSPVFGFDAHDAHVVEVVGEAEFDDALIILLERFLEDGLLRRTPSWGRG